MFARRGDAKAAVKELQRIEDLVRARFDLSPGQLVLVSEDRARLSGAPNRMTTILFWTAPDERHKLRIFKPAAQVAPADIPPRWLRGALMDDGAADCC
jgi:hypothetical protein